MTGKRIRIEISPRTVFRCLALLFILTFTIVSHEIGHAIEMEMNGIDVGVIALGMDFDVIPTFDFTLKNLPGITLRVSPLLIGGYVKAANPEMLLSTQGLTTDAYVSALRAGIGVNLVTGFLCLAFSALLDRKKFSRFLPIVLGAAAAAILMTYTCPQLLLLLGPPIIACEIIIRVKAHQNPKKKLTMSIREIIRFMYESTKSLSAYLFALGVFAIALAWINVLPIYPLDGGKILNWYIESYSEAAGTWYRYGCYVAILCIAFAAAVYALNKWYKARLEEIDRRYQHNK